jgi:hypothetical protein
MVQNMSANHNTGSMRHSLEERGNDLYETPRAATEALIRTGELPKLIWEPACGRGAIVGPLREAGYSVAASDINPQGVHGATVVDFLSVTKPCPFNAIVTNPPYKHANAFVRQGLKLAPKVILLLRWAYAEGARRSDIIDGHLTRVYLGKERLPMMHRDGWEGPKVNTGAMPFAWFVFEAKPKAWPEFTVHRISWRAGGEK